MLLHLTSPPTFVTPQSHTQITSTTPTSFDDIPPILRWASEVVENAENDQQRGGVVHGQGDVGVEVSGGWEGWVGLVKGRLWVTEVAVCFLPLSGPGFNLPFPSLTLHALTPRTPNSPAHLYLQVDESKPEGTGGMDIVDHGNGNGESSGGGVSNGGGIEGDGGDDEDEDDDEDDGGDEYTPMREIRIFVDDEKLQPLFQALSSCSALHASLLPSGEPSSFFGFADDPEDDDDAYEDIDGDGDGEGGEGEGANGNGIGRVRSDFWSGGGPDARFRPY